MQTFPVIYELEPTGVDGALEANGHTQRFCTPACRDTITPPADHAYGDEAASDVPEGWTCDGANCDTVLVPSPLPHDVFYEHQAGCDPIRLSHGIRVF